MNIGYACITTGLPYTKQRSCVQKSATEELLRELIDHNLSVLEKQIDYNIHYKIPLFRISSDLIPFGSSPVNTLDWSTEFAEKFAQIGAKIKSAGMRVSLHPGQYTVLTSSDAGVIERSVEDLRYHATILDALDTGPECKIILHVGGVYGDKATATHRFAQHWSNLPDAVKARLIIENDERCYHIADVLELATRLGIPVVYDNLHNAVYPADPNKGDSYWIREAAATWQPCDGRQKVHYSQQDPEKKLGAHAQRIRLPEFLSFVEALDGQRPDVMLEVKDKDLSAIKCLTALSSKRKITALEAEWARYKYLVLEHDPHAYQQIRTLLKDKSAYPVVGFYDIIDRSLEKEPSLGTFENAASHVWGYFKNQASSAEKQSFERSLTRLRAGSLSSSAIKRQLWKFVQGYHETYLMDSLFFTS